jgi:uncharacterized protein
VTDHSPPAAGPARTYNALDPWPETVEWRPVSGDLIKVELIARALRVVPTTLILLIAWLIIEHWALLAALIGLLLIAAWRSAITARAVRAWGYAERDNDLLVRHGLLVRRLSIVPYARMQFVDVTAGPLERAFDLATVQLHTAAAASDARVPGLRPAEAARLRDRLTALGEDRAEGL